MKRTAIIWGLACFLPFVLAGCGNGEKKGRASKAKEATAIAEKQLNITFLLDLSDRIDPSEHPASPEHGQRDIAAVNSVVAIFKTHMNQMGAYKAKSRIRVLINPLPREEDINEIMKKMNIDLSKMKKPAEKKVVFDSMERIFSENITKVYDLAIQQQSYPGSDIWRFFKNDIDHAIAADTNYRNILIVLTDGYIYHKNSQIREKNRASYLTGPMIERNGFRKNNNWRQKFDEGDYGFLATRSDLDNLEVLVLEVTPSPDHLDDEDVIRAYLAKWFDEMGIRRYAIYNSDLPVNTKMRIERFVAEF